MESEDLKSDSGSEFSDDLTKNYFEKEDTEQKNISVKRKYEDIPNDNASQKRKHKSELYKPPTVEELNNLKETENLFNNNLFRLQIDELLSEVHIKNKRKKNLSDWLKSFELFLKELPEYEILLSSIKKLSRKKSEKDKLINKLAQYDNCPKTDQDMMLKFVKPLSYEKFGLYEYNALPGPTLSVSLNLIMPKSCFHSKDFLNNRYWAKRYFYLLYVLEHLKLTEIVTNVAITTHEDNSLIPLLTIEPKNCGKILILIYATPASDTFKPARFLPEKNNVKLNVFDSNLDDNNLKNSPTIFYNSSLAHDVTLSINNDFMKGVLQDLKNLQEGIKLICIWLKQRELDTGVGSFTEILVVYFIVYLFHKKKINQYMSSYQVIRNFWSFISTSDLQNEPISIADTGPDILNSFKNYFDIVFLDKSGCYNVTAFLTKEMFRKFKFECQIALKYLDNNKNNSFQLLFLTKFPFHLQFDLVIDLTKSLPLEVKYDFTEHDKSLYVGFDHLLIANHILKIIERALNKRILNIVLKLGAENKILNRFLIGINLNNEEAFKFLEIGPALNDHSAAAEFRRFWGHLSSDRRFRDGSTNVAVYFKTNTIKAKRNIIKKILNFVLDEKLNLKHKIYYDEFEDVLFSKRIVAPYPSGTNEETTLKIIQASDELGKKLRALQMSLKITGVQGISDVFNFSEVFPPIPTNYKVGHGVTVVQGNNLIFSNKKIGLVPRYVKPIANVLQLEHSSKWPNNLQALRHIKTSFYLEISKMLQAEHKIISHVTPNFIEVYFQGFLFRYYLYVPKEIGLLKKVATENGVTCFRESVESSELEKSLNIMPKVTAALKGIQSQYPNYGPGTALIKRWLRSQLIDDFYFPDIVINLLNASFYLDGTHVQVNTPQMSFLRFLKFISEFDWDLQAVLVNFNDDISNKEVTELETKLQQNRSAYPNLYIIMPYDQGLSIFTKKSPTKEILHRVKQLSRESLNFYNHIIMDQNHVGIKELFIPNFEGYNVLIHLRPLLNSRRHEQICFSNVEGRIVLEKYVESEENKLPISDFDPVNKYLDTLRTNYGKYGMFFHDSYGGNVIGVLWNPRIYESVDFKVSQVNAMTLANDKLCFNIDAVIEDFFIIGKDLVKTIEKR